MQLFVLSQNGPACSTQKQRRPTNATMCVVSDWTSHLQHTQTETSNKCNYLCCPRMGWRCSLHTCWLQRTRSKQCKRCVLQHNAFSNLMLQTQLCLYLCPEGTCPESQPIVGCGTGPQILCQVSENLHQGCKHQSKYLCPPR